MKVSVPRKKVCQQCTSAKIRCDVQRPRCSTCIKKGLKCRYENTLEESNNHHARAKSTSYSRSGVAVVTSRSGDNDQTLSAPTPPISGATTRIYRVGSENESESESGVSNSFRPSDLSGNVLFPGKSSGAAESRSSLPFPTPTGDFGHENADAPSILQLSREQPCSSRFLNFANVKLLPTSSIDTIRIGDRWLTSLLHISPTARIKQMSPSTVQYLYRTLKTYPRMMLRVGGLPPIIHLLQLTGPETSMPLANSISLARMWEVSAVGSEQIVTDIVVREMERLMKEHEVYNQMDLLGACQAYLIYSIMKFSLHSDGGIFNRSIPINLQTLFSSLSATGLVCPEELSATRPSWESWIVAEAKRRTLYTMYMFDNIFNALNDLPYFVAEELATLPAPSSKNLWQLKNRDEWEREYTFQLGRWAGDGCLRLGELWPQAETIEAGKLKRIDQWLESVDEFGMMLFSVVVHTYGNYM